MKDTSILGLAQIFAQAIQEVVARSCQLEVSLAKTAQFVPNIQISEDVGGFVSFYGNYNGLMVVNFEGNAALELVTASLRTMGVPESEIPTHHTADDVRNSIGELLNHVIGKARAIIQTKYELTAYATIPAVVPITTPIGLVFRTPNPDGYSCVRLVFRTPYGHRFHMELTVEPTLFVTMNNKNQASNPPA